MYTYIYYVYLYTYIYIYEHSSILLVKSCARDKRGGVLSLLRGLAQLKTKVSFFEVPATIWSRFSPGLRGHRFGSGVLSLLGLFAWLLYVTAFLLLVHDCSYRFLRRGSLGDRLEDPQLSLTSELSENLLRRARAWIVDERPTWGARGGCSRYGKLLHKAGTWM